MTTHSPDIEKVKRYFKKDQFANLLGIELVELSLGRAVARMTLRKDHYNSISIAHGGAIFTLADLAFAAASNSHGLIAVAINANISFLKATSTGTLTATAEEVSRSRKLATYTIRIQDEEGNVIALFQGTTYCKNEPLNLE